MAYRGNNITRSAVPRRRRVLRSITGNLEYTGRTFMGMADIAMGRIMADGNNLQCGKYRCE
jgi:hypothetical protein